MNVKYSILSLLMGGAISVLHAEIPNGHTPDSLVLPYQDTSLTAEQRADDLLKRLTLEEKAALMQNSSPAIPRLGIKEYDWWNEALHGVGRAGLATVFPQAIGMAASFNDTLLYDVFSAVSDEARAKSYVFGQDGKSIRYQGLTFWTPNINIFRDPRWGRGQETYGEDPYLTSRMGVAVINGLQGTFDGKHRKLHACAKHFAVHSGPEWNRHSYNAENIAPRDLWETYLPAFQVAVEEANVQEVMCAYNRLEGEPCCGNNRLLMQILRNRWHFDGLVVSDCWAISDFYTPNAHETDPDSKHASAKAVLNGTDLECGDNYVALPDAVRAGLIDEKQIDISLKRLLKARYELGEMDSESPWIIPYDVVNSDDHKALALKMARESMVLLQNNDHILPLNKQLKVAIMGPNAADSVMQWGNYNGFPEHTVTLLEAVKNKLPESQIIYEPGCDRTADKGIKSLFDKCSFDGKNGFSATYWDNIKREGKPVAVAQIVTPFQFTTKGATVFAPGVPLKNFSAKYTTVFTPTKSEKISFRFQVDGAALLYINKKEVARAFFVSGFSDVYSMEVETGNSYEIEIFYVQRGDNATLKFDFGSEFMIDQSSSISRVKDADVVIFAGGIAPSLEGEEMTVTVPGFKGGDRTNIELPKVQIRMLEALKKAGKHIIFVNYSGSAIGLSTVAQYCDAIVQAWYPGQAGGTAVADVIFGDYNPGGRLPVTFYKDVNQLPDFEDYNMKGRTYRYMTDIPTYSFGYGLSYTTFVYGKAKVENGKNITLTIPISNTGKVDGDEVVQVYLRRPTDKEGPLRTLRAFKRVHITAGTTQNVTITLNDNSFAWFDPSCNSMRPLNGKFEILYGGSSQLKDLKKVTVTRK